MKEDNKSVCVVLGTGGTILRGMAVLKEMGARQIICAVSLPMFSGSAVETYEEAYRKGLFYRQLEMGIDAAYQLAGQTMACNMMDEAALEGVQAFIEKRPAAWAAKA